MQLVKAVYELPTDFPTEERYGLSQQMSRPAVSIPSNIAEGAGRNGAKEYSHFIGVTRGSLTEPETQLQQAVMLNVAFQDHAASDLVDRTGKLLPGMDEKWSAA